MVIVHLTCMNTHKDLKSESESELFNLGCLRMDHECSD